MIEEVGVPDAHVKWLRLRLLLPVMVDDQSVLAVVVSKVIVLSSAHHVLEDSQADQDQKKENEEDQEDDEEDCPEFELALTLRRVHGFGAGSIRVLGVENLFEIVGLTCVCCEELNLVGVQTILITVGFSLEFPCFHIELVESPFEGQIFIRWINKLDT